MVAGLSWDVNVNYIPQFEDSGWKNNADVIIISTCNQCKHYLG